MSFETVWSDLREACSGLDEDDVLVTPRAERPFTVRAVDDDRVTVDFLDREEDRSLWRAQFEVLYDRLAGGETLNLSELPAGVGPYVAVLSLSPQFDAVDRRFRHVEDSADESPFLRPDWTTRSAPERAHDDALLLADALERYDAASRDVAAMDDDDLVNLYVLLSDVASESDDLRRSAGETLLERIGPDGRLHGQFGSVTRTERERRRPKPAEEVFEVLEEAGVPREWAVGVDPDKLDVVLSVTDVDPDDVLEVDEQVYVQKTDVEEAEKQSRLEGLKARLADVDDEAAADLHEEIEGLERRIDEVLASG